jgi:sulfonate transport system permease protein
MKSEGSVETGHAKTVKLLVGLVIPVGVLISWQILSDMGRVNESIFANPLRVAEAFESMIARGTYFKHITASLIRILKGFAIGSLIGFSLGSLAILFKWIGYLFDTVIGLLRPIPPISFIPFLILWLGIGEKSKVAVITIGAFWPVLLNTMQGIKSADEKLLELGRAFGKDKHTILFKLILPSAFPSIFTGLRLAIGNAWNCVVTAEMIASSVGLGFLISYGRELSRPEVLFVGIVSIGIVGFLVDTLVIRLQRRVVYWVEPQK